MSKACNHCGALYTVSLDGPCGNCGKIQKTARELFEEVLELKKRIAELEAHQLPCGREVQVSDPFAFCPYNCFCPAKAGD